MQFDLKNAFGFSWALDESYDVTDTEQLIIWVRFESGDTFKEVLAMIPLKDTTRGEDLYRALKECLLKNDIDIKKLISVTIDGAPGKEEERGLDWLAC